MPGSITQVRGQLIFQQAGPGVALHHVPVELWHRRGHRHVKVGEGRTDLEGQFAVELDGPLDLPQQLELRTFDAKSHYEGDEQTIAQHKVSQVAVSQVAVSQVAVSLVAVSLPADSTGDVGTLAVPYWPYRTDAQLARAGLVEGALPQKYTKGFMKILAGAALKGLPTRAALTAQHKVKPSGPGLAEIQRHQPKTLTLRADEAEEGRSRSDAWLGDQLLNGFDVALVVGRDKLDAKRFRAAIEWGDVPRPTREFDLADVSVALEDQGGSLLPVEIKLANRRPVDDGTWKVEEHVVRPGDDQWEAAKRVVRCTYLLHGATDGHITLTHFQTEQVAVACFRNLRLNPIRQLLEPHLQEIVAQDHDGDNFAWGPKGLIAVQSALSHVYLDNRMRDQSAWRDWKTFKPREPLTDAHRYAKAGNLFWALLQDYVGAFVDEHRADITAQWAELRAFSDDLVEHSPVYRAPPRPAEVAWTDLNEHDRADIERPARDGVVRAVRPLTTSATPAEGELEALVQLCCYYLYQATFNHTWTHDGQYDAGGELAYATFALRNGSLGPESDEDIAPSPKMNIDYISTNTLGLAVNYGYLLKDEERDVPPAFKAALESRREAFKALGVDVDSLRSRINI